MVKCLTDKSKNNKKKKVRQNLNKMKISIDVLLTLMMMMIVHCSCKTNYAYYNDTYGIITGQSSTGLLQYRNGKFLFDTIFGLDTAATNDEEEDDEQSNDVKTCNCGMYLC